MEPKTVTGPAWNVFLRRVAELMDSVDKRQMAREVGFNRPSVKTMIKQGEMRAPLE